VDFGDGILIAAELGFLLGRLWEVALASGRHVLLAPGKEAVFLPSDGIALLRPLLLLHWLLLLHKDPSVIVAKGLWVHTAAKLAFTKSFFPSCPSAGIMAVALVLGFTLLLVFGTEMAIAGALLLSERTVDSPSGCCTARVEKGGPETSGSRICFRRLPFLLCA
jgi:hypothetical protein